MEAMIPCKHNKNEGHHFVHFGGTRHCWCDGGRPVSVDDFNIEAMAAELATDNGDDYEQLSKAARMAVQVVARDYLAAALEQKQ